MSGRLDQSLDSIIDSQKKAKKDIHRRRKPGAKVSKAPVGGVKKATKPAKPAVKPSAATPHVPASKIFVSGLPLDVNEAMIKDYFNKAIGPVRKASLQYNQNGSSRGIADVIFAKAGHAAKAAKSLNGLLIDKRPMKIELIVDAGSVPEAKGLAERVTTNPKAQPKSAVTNKANAKGAKAGKPKKPKNAKPKPKAKTVDELDAEMADYFVANNGGAAAAAAATNGAAGPAAAGEDMGMDEIS